MPSPKRARRPLSFAAGLIILAAAAAFSLKEIHALAEPGPIAAVPDLNLSQDDQNAENTEVSPSQVEQYVKVYKAMQRDRTLSVDQAAAAQHLSVEQFRDIEARIERDAVLRERVRRELLKTAEKKSNALKPKLQSAPSSSKP